jgi:hypothetical protein
MALAFLQFDLLYLIADTQQLYVIKLILLTWAYSNDLRLPFH